MHCLHCCCVRVWGGAPSTPGFGCSDAAAHAPTSAAHARVPPTSAGPLPAVSVFGVADPVYGEAIAARVILRDGFTAGEDVAHPTTSQHPRWDAHAGDGAGTKMVTAGDIRAFCHGRIAAFKVPKYIEFAADFPKTASGKIQKVCVGVRGLCELGSRGVRCGLRLWRCTRAARVGSVVAPRCLSRPPTLPYWPHTPPAPRLQFVMRAELEEKLGLANKKQ